jgi:hypothetical protein
MDGSSGWHWTFADDAAAFGVADGALRARMTTSEAWWRYALGPDGAGAADQQINVRAHLLTCEGDDEYGLAFHANGNPAGGDDLYVFRLRCSGAASFLALTGGETVPLVAWTAAPAVRAGALADNDLTVWMRRGEFRFYANGEYLFSAHDERLTAGDFGFYLYDRTGGGLDVSFDDLVARAVGPVAAE